MSRSFTNSSEKTTAIGKSTDASPLTTTRSGSTILLKDDSNKSMDAYTHSTKLFESLTKMSDFWGTNNFDNGSDADALTYAREGSANAVVEIEQSAVDAITREAAKQINRCSVLRD